MYIISFVLILAYDLGAPYLAFAALTIILPYPCST